VLYAGFGFLDYMFYSEFYKQFFFIRYFIAIPSILTLFIVSFSKRFYFFWQSFTSLIFIVSGACIIYMMLIAQNNTYYYGGVFLVFSAGYFLVKLRFVWASISGLAIVVIYNLGTLLFNKLYNITYSDTFIVNMFYISTNIINMIALYNIEKLKRVDFYQKRLLLKNQNEIKNSNLNLEKQVKERTILLDKRNKELIAEINKKKKIERKLIAAKEKAEESDKLKSSFLANMSHEIRTPMNGILGFTQLLAELDLSADERKRYIEIIQQSGNRLLNIINDLIDISKIESGQVEVKISETNILEQLNFIYDFFKTEAKSKKIDLYLNVYLQEHDAVVDTDREKVYAVLTNLVKNSIKFTECGNIEIGCYKAGNNIKIYVKDTGVGIPKEKQQIVFDRFTQIEGVYSRNYQGSGLGLSISKAYIEMLGGKINVKSKSGKGSIFYFTIPA
jgi:signal transduction histidine kinase